MNTSLCLSIRFIQPYPLFHGSRDAGAAEWPPSPMRVFQALLNAACLGSRGKTLANDVLNALKVLEVLRPLIVSPRATQSIVGHRAYVPHNHADLVTSAWHRGNNDASIASHRIEKDYRPIRIETVGDDLPAVHYLYPLDEDNADPQSLLEAIRPIARSIHCVGWGIDQVVADAQLIAFDQTSLLKGERYAPASSGGLTLRSPRKGSLVALHARYDRFRNRLTGNDWTPVPPMTAFDQVRYRPDGEPLPRPHALFKLVDPDEGDSARYPHAKLMHIAAMVRHLAIQACQRAGYDDPDFINRFVRGKNDGNRDDHKQISYMPLPSIGHTHADALIRNVMLIAPLGMEKDLAKVARVIEGGLLTPETVHDAGGCDAQAVVVPDYRAQLQSFHPPKGKFIAEGYLGTHRVWHTVTPIILDEHAKKVERKNEETGEPEKDWNHDALICLALKRAGVETPCRFTWQAQPFLKNCLSAHRYNRDKKPTGYYRPKRFEGKTAVHVRIEFDHPVPGPITLGAGRHCGFGLMVGEHNGQQNKQHHGQHHGEHNA